MKYFLSIFSILAAITAVTLIFNWPEQQLDDDYAVVTINGRTLTNGFFQKHKGRVPKNTSNENYIDTIIRKQLLITEAQRRQIDQQPAFRLALQTLYENSLIELLLKQVKSELKTTVSSEEVENYLQAFGKTYTFYTLYTPELVTINEIKREGTKHVSLFDDLSIALRQSLAAMDPQSLASTHAFNKEKIAIYLEKIEGRTPLPQDLDKRKIKNQLQQIKDEKQISAWIEDLRSQAVITYHINQE